MSVYSGPKTPTSNQVFTIDFANITKSWIGYPTTNLVTSPNDITYWSASNTTTKILYTIPLPSEIAPRCPTLDKASLVFGGGGWIAHTSTSVTPNTQYMCSFYVKPYNTESSVSFGFGGAHQGTSSIYTLSFINGAISGVSLVSGETYSVSDVGDGWWRIACSTTMTGTACYPQLNYTVGLYIAGCQIERGNSLTAFTIGTRSNTQSILDVTKQTTITSNNISYSTAFLFNGANNFIMPNVVPNSSQGSVSVWFKLNVLKDYNTLFDNSVGPDDWELWVYATGIARFRTSSGNLDVIVSSSGSNPLSTGVYYNIIVTWSPTNARMYLNGVLQEEDLVMGTRNTPGTMYIGGGNPGNTKLDGFIYMFSLYNRSLTEQEIAMHFNSYRSRFRL